MMGRLNRDQEQLFYSFSLDDAVPDDHPVRGIATVLDLSWVHLSDRASLSPTLRARRRAIELSPYEKNARRDRAH